MIQDKLINPLASKVIDHSYEYKQEKLWEVYPDEPTTIHASNFGTRSYLDSDLVTETQVTVDGELIPGSTPLQEVGTYMSHDMPRDPEDTWIPLTTYTNIKPQDTPENSDNPQPQDNFYLKPQEKPITLQENTSTMFVENAKNLGVLTVGKETSVVFKYSDKVKLLKQITSPCDCTKVYNDNGAKEITVKYTPKVIPVHLKHQGFYTTIKLFTVIFGLEDDTEQAASFSFEAKIVR